MCFAGLAGLIGGGASMGAGMLSSVAQNDAAADAAVFNSKIARQNADIQEQKALQAEKVGAQEEKKHLQEVRQLLGSQRAMFGASGAVVDTGSTFDVTADTMKYGVEDALTIRHNAAMNAWGYRAEKTNFLNQATMYDVQASNYKKQANKDFTFLTGGDPLGGMIMGPLTGRGFEFRWDSLYGNAAVPGYGIFNQASNFTTGMQGGSW